MDRISQKPLPIQPDVDSLEVIGQKVGSQDILALGFDQADQIETSSPQQVAANGIQQEFQDQFKAMASDKEKFHALMKEVYGENYNAEAAESFRQKALNNDFSWMPPIEFRDEQSMQGGNGAYDSERGVVYINERFLDHPELAAKVYMEEVGAYLDTQLKSGDTQGDEGELFRKLMSGEKLTAAQIAAIRADNDAGVVYVDGKATEVEFSIFDDIWDGIKEVGSRVWDGVTGLVDGVVETVRGAAYNIWEGISTFGGGIAKIFSGDFADGFADLGKGLLKTFIQTPVDAILMMGGRAISAIQTLFFLEPVARKLTDNEIEALRKVYGDSIDYSKIEIKEGNAGLLTLSGRPFTHGNTIYFPEDALPITEDVLVHETAHVWQNQNGGTDYMGEALYAQFFGDGYDWEKGVDAGLPFEELNPEQQAEIIQEAYSAGYFDTGVFISGGVDYTAYMDEVMRQVRASEGAP